MYLDSYSKSRLILSLMSKVINLSATLHLDPANRKGILEDTKHR